MALKDNAWYISTVAFDALTKWSNHTETAGHVIQPFTAQAYGSERAYVCTVAGATGSTEPTWSSNLTRGKLVTSSSAVYQECTGIAALNGDLTNTPSWSDLTGNAAFAVTLGQVIKRNSGASIWTCTVAGTTGTSEPTWPDDNAGTTLQDGTGGTKVTWTCLGASFGVLAAPMRTLEHASTSTWGQAGNVFFVADNHAQTKASSITMTMPGTITSPAKIISFDHNAGSVPPTSALSGASVSLTGGSVLTFSGFMDVDGLTFNGGTSGAAHISVAAGASQSTIWRNCSFNLRSSSACYLSFCTNGQIGSARLFNCNVNFTGNVGSYLYPFAVNLIWRGGVMNYTTNKPTVLLNLASGAASSICLFEGVDLSGWDSNLVGTAITNGLITFKDCKLHASTVIMNGYPQAMTSMPTELIRSDSGNTVYKIAKRSFAGDLTTDTTTIRTAPNGATDGTTTHSWKLVTTSNAGSLAVFECPPILLWNNATSGTIDVTLFGAGAAIPTNAGLWFECVYLGDASYPDATIASCGLASQNASPANWDTDSVSTWGGSPSYKFSKTLTISPRQKGYIHIYLKMAVAGTTLYIDPRPIVTSGGPAVAFSSLGYNELFDGVPRSHCGIGA